MKDESWMIDIKEVWIYEYFQIFVEEGLWNLPYPELFYLGTSVVWTAQINYVVCSLIKVLVKVQGESLHSVVYFLGHLLQYISMWF